MYILEHTCTLCPITVKGHNCANPQQSIQWASQ